VSYTTYKSFKSPQKRSYFMLLNESNIECSEMLRRDINFLLLESEKRGGSPMMLCVGEGQVSKHVRVS